MQFLSSIEREVTMPTISVQHANRPWHLWLVAVLTFLWDGSGALTILLAQAGRLPNISAGEAAYYAAQPAWFVATTDIALLAALAAAVALLMRSKAAAGLFALSLVAILVTNGYDLVAGTSRAFSSTGALVVTFIIVIAAILQLVYAWAMNRRNVLN
jgi:hypothetical protein